MVEQEQKTLDKPVEIMATIVIDIPAYKSDEPTQEHFKKAYKVTSKRAYAIHKSLQRSQSE
jgi:hypothetical protein